MSAHFPPAPVPRDPRSRYLRVALHLAGLAAAGIIAWLLWQGWRQPELLLDFAAMRLC
ncbi:MAG TPA: hypothetical protein VFQ55_01630 [Casimicrobiaceae bacterium]|nr:hypothetical protein [Casimicrobiaceae bacterium]